MIINLSGRHFSITFCENASKLDPLRHHLDSLVTESDTVMAGNFPLHRPAWMPVKGWRVLQCSSCIALLLIPELNSQCFGQHTTTKPFKMEPRRKKKREKYLYKCIFYGVLLKKNKH